MLLCAQYVVPVSSDPIEKGAVLVKDDKITDIGSMEMMKLRYPEEEVRDFGMAAITPGFIDLRALAKMPFCVVWFLIFPMLLGQRRLTNFALSFRLKSVMILHFLVALNQFIQALLLSVT